MFTQIKQALCRHNKVSLRRVYSNSQFACRNRGKHMWIDEKGTLNFIYCTQCFRVLEPWRPDTRIYGEKK